MISSLFHLLLAESLKFSINNFIVVLKEKMIYLKNSSTVFLVVILVNTINSAHGGPINSDEPINLENEKTTEQTVAVTTENIFIETETLKNEDLVRDPTPVSTNCPSGQILEDGKCQNRLPLVKKTKTKSPLTLSMSIPRRAVSSTKYNVDIPIVDEIIIKLNSFGGKTEEIEEDEEESLKSLEKIEEIGKIVINRTGK